MEGTRYDKGCDVTCLQTINHKRCSVFGSKLNSDSAMGGETTINLYIHTCNIRPRVVYIRSAKLLETRLCSTFLDIACFLRVSRQECLRRALWDVNRLPNQVTRSFLRVYAIYRNYDYQQALSSSDPITGSPVLRCVVTYRTVWSRDRDNQMYSHC